MDLKYDVYTITNAEGSGEERKYVRLKQYEAMTAHELEATIQQRCSLTKGDVAAVLSELHDIVVSEFSMGRRVYIPELGYFSLAVNLEMPADKPNKKITGKEVRLRGINFRPEAGLLREIDRNIHFVRSQYSSRSTIFTEEALGKIAGIFPEEPLSHHQTHEDTVWTVSPHGTKVDKSLHSQRLVGKGWYSPFTDLFLE